MTMTVCVDEEFPVAIERQPGMTVNDFINQAYVGRIHLMRPRSEHDKVLIGRAVANYGTRLSYLHDDAKITVLTEAWRDEKEGTVSSEEPQYSLI